MQQRHVTPPDTATIIKYIEKIFAASQHKDADAAVQEIILEAAAAGILPWLHNPDTGLEIFEEVDPGVIKTAIASVLLNKQEDWTGLENLRQNDIEKKEAVERRIASHKEMLDKEVEQCKPHLMTFSILQYAPDYSLEEELADKVPQNKLPVIFKNKDEIWLYDLDLEGNRVLKESSNPSLYKGISFPLSDSRRCLLLSDSIFPLEITVPPEIKQELRSLKEARLVYHLNAAQSQIAKMEAKQKLLRETQKKLILEVIKLGWFLSEEDLGKYQSGFLGMSKNEALDIKQEVKKLLPIQEGASSVRYPKPATESEFKKITDSLKAIKYSTFKKMIKRNICSILSRDVQDEGRKLLIKNLQKADFSGVGNDPARCEYGKFFVEGNFNGADLTDACFAYSHFINGQFEGATLVNANFTSALLLNGNFTNANLQGANLSVARLSESLNHPRHAVFHGANLKFVTLNRKGIFHDIAIFCPDQVLQGTSVRGISIHLQTLEEKYTPEDRKKLRDRLVKEYEMFFTESNNPEEIIETLFEISPHIRKATIYQRSSTLNVLNYLIKEGNEKEREKHNQEICEPLLTIAYTKLLSLVQKGVRVSKRTLEFLEFGGPYPDNLPKDMFGKDHTKINVILHEIKPYVECLDRLDTINKYLKEINEKTESNLEDDEKIRNALVEAFNKLFELFTVRGTEETDCKANNIFDQFNGILKALYAIDDARVQTLVGLFLSKELRYIKRKDELLFRFVETLFMLEADEEKLSKKEKWQLILSLLRHAKSFKAQDLQIKVFYQLKQLSNSALAWKTGNSLAEIAGVDCVLNSEDLEAVIKYLLSLKVSPNTAVSGSETSLGSRTDAKTLESGKVWLEKIKGKKIALYEELVMTPDTFKVIELFGDDLGILGLLNPFVEESKKHTTSLAKDQKKWLAQLSHCVNEEPDEDALDDFFAEDTDIDEELIDEELEEEENSSETDVELEPSDTKNNTNAFDFTQMSLKFLNPFRGIIETNTFSNARTLRTSFNQKLMDAWDVLAGSSEPRNREEPNFVWHNIGIFDLLTLGIFAASFSWGMNTLRREGENSLLKGFSYLILIINVPFLIARFLIVAVLVFNPVSLLVIGLVDLVSQYYAGGNKLKEQVVAGITSTCQEICPEKEFEQLEKMNFQLFYENNALSGLSHVRLKQAVNRTVFLPIFKKNASDDEKRLAKAILKLNFSGVTRQLEDGLKNDDEKEECRRVLNQSDKIHTVHFMKRY